MLTCQNCGADNPLGCVFCRGCGRKLDLSRVTTEEVDKSARKGRLRQHAAKLILLPILLVVVLIGLAFWPRTRLLGEAGTVAGSRRVEDRLTMFNRLGRGRSLGSDPAFTEADINGFLRFGGGNPMGVQAASVDISPERARGRLVKPLFSVRIANFRFRPVVSYDMKLTEEEGRPVLRGAAIGHLPVFGPLASFVRGKCLEIATRNRGVKVLADVRQVTLHEGSVGVILER